ncbi:DUF3139 domain-containing protein [Niallia sp. Marseille-Q9988]
MFIISFICIILLLFGGFKINEFFNGNKSKLEEAKKDVYDYLIEKEGYKEDDILEIEPSYSFVEAPENAYFAFVRFKDNPSEKVYYSRTVRDDETIISRN